jgi:mannonate dehydratase
MTAIAAVDVALWDILGKMSGSAAVSAARRTLARRRARVRPCERQGHRRSSDEVGKYIAQATRRCARRCGVPGIKKAYGISSLKNAYEPAESELPTETVWATPKYLATAPKLFERLRNDHGPDIELLHDVHHRLSPIEAARLARDLEPYRLFWLEDATPAENQKSFRAGAQTFGDAARGGRSIQLDLGLQTSHRESAHRLHPHDDRSRRRHHARAAHRGFRGAARRAHRIPRRHRSFAGMHGSRAALRHLGAELRHPGVHEARTETDEMFPHDYLFRDGRLHCGEAPGHGVTIDEKLAARFPYSPKQLPIARLEDGTMWDW